MEVKPGYKQTEVGVIPADWDVVRLGHHSEITKLAGFEYSKHFNSYKDGGEIIVIRGTNITHNSLDLSDIKTIPKSTSDKLPRSKLKKADLVFAYVGTIGPVFLIDKDNQYHLGPNTARITCKDGLYPHFLFCYFLSDLIHKEISERISTGAQPSLSMTKIRDFWILKPTLAEQEAIAEALSDADALIESLELLIAMKRHIKQGAMQELLCPKDEWVPTCLGDIADQRQRWSFTGGPFGSNLKSSDYTDEGVRIIQLQNIGDGEFRNDYEVYTSSWKADELLSCNIYPGEIILSKMGDPVARACLIPAYHERYLMCSDGIRLAVDQKRFNTYFIYTVINAPDFRTKAANSGKGSTRKRIGLTELRNLEMLCPPFLEQTAIATILSDMDTEIAAQEAKLAKARQLKRGMMQELLTGKTRLV